MFVPTGLQSNKLMEDKQKGTQEWMTTKNCKSEFTSMIQWLNLSFQKDDVEVYGKVIKTEISFH